MVLRVSLIGPGDIDFHYFELLKLSKRRFESEINNIAEALVRAEVEIELLPDRGISFEIARKYREIGGRKVIGAVPLSDKTFGITHLKEFIEAEVNGKKVFDEIIDTENWYKHDLIKALLGNAVLYLGRSPGAEGERQYGVYLYKLFKRFKQGVDVTDNAVHQEIRAGTKIPYTFLIYTPFLIDRKMPREDEAYAEKFGVNLVYISNVSELEKRLKQLAKSV